MHNRPGIFALLLFSLCCLPASPPVRAQSTFPEPTFVEPDPLGLRRPTPPTLSFVELAEIPLPGPLPDADPRLAGDRIEILVAGGVARTAWTPDAQPELLPTATGEEPAASEPTVWVTDPTGRFRYGAPDGDRLVAEKKCKRCKRGWKRKWRLRIAGIVVAPPVVTDKRIYFGALDNRVYSLKRRNGHRMWVSELEARLRRPLVLISGAAAGQPLKPSDEQRVLEILLALPGTGSEIVALHAYTGDRLASFELPEAGGLLVGRPLATPDGRIVVARQKYSQDQASLLVLQLQEKAPVQREELDDATAEGAAAAVEAPAGSIAP